MEGDRLDDEQIALVIRRASELDGQSPAGQPGLDLALLEEAAVEAGLSRESVRRAVAELRAGALAVDSGVPSRRTALGPASLTVSRCVPGPLGDVDGILRRFLAKEQFHLRRDFGTSSTWTRRQDVGARVRVHYDRSIHRRLLLRDAEQVELAVVEEPGDRGMVMVKLTVDVKPLRRAHRVAVGKGASAGAAVAGVALVVLSMPVEAVAVPAALAGGVALGHRRGVRQYRDMVGDVETALEGFLDGVERRR
ncbi:MAG TPA: hypothetical protein VFK43_09260 [Acidimicrobiales bacterium]|nr:hypothetical protein [Acidimicrobiales bacterium]